MAHPWNVNRLLVTLGGACVLAATFLFVSAGTSVAEASPLLPGILAAGVLLFYAPAWMYLVAAVLVAAFPLLVVLVFGAYEAMIHPGAGTEGASIMLLTLGALLGLLGGILGFAQVRRGTAPALDATLRSPQGNVALALFGLTVGLMLANAWAAKDQQHQAEFPASILEPDETVELRTADFDFAPKNVTIPAGRLVALHITNDDPAVHTFSFHYDGADRDEVIPAKSETTLYFRFTGPQVIEFWCAPHSGGADDDGNGMVGTLTVE